MAQTLSRASQGPEVLVLPLLGMPALWFLVVALTGNTLPVYGLGIALPSLMLLWWASRLRLMDRWVAGLLVTSTVCVAAALAGMTYVVAGLSAFH